MDVPLGDDRWISHSAGARWRAVVLGAAVLALCFGCSGEDTTSPAPSTATPAIPGAPTVPSSAVEAFGDPAAVELPAVTDDAAKAWLSGDGAAAVAMLDASEALVAGGAEVCDQTAERLDVAGTPEELLAAAAGTPDGPTQELLVGLHTTLASALGSCANQAGFATAVGELSWQAALTRRRLDELGVGR